MSKSKKKSKVTSSKESSETSVVKKTVKKKAIHAKIIKKKPYLEFITAFLSIPVLITVMLLNFNSLKNINATPTPTPGIGGTKSGFFGAPVGTARPTAVFNGAQASCTKSIGPISIDTPNENDSVANNPVTVNISYDESTHCGVAWSYRINGGDWSGYDDRSFALYNLPKGPVKFELRVKSIASDDQKTLTRNFTYAGQSTVLIPNTATNSAQ
jgi:hypothetical protein